ncbi:RlpA-like double-psi beta-barrel-protein domain-containing protein-containing protein [Mycena maculata]|uniref:RlpA-like double-psi beta-barrel-protein domain-containing protein-containing protein n=1 Tax=Mycena maculata TaxID=230809 RepID=A0AAD7KCG9_9AGAR|nr:RlpA-like double-psi beta-barrel-protein domain-containing protein-containing protein [Mycena maculata]
MSRIAVLFTAFWCALLALAVPLQQGNTTVADLAKRVTHVGRGTWYYPSAGEGNCGYWDSNSDPVVAIGIARYDANGGANCNQWIQITNEANGKVAYGKTRDSCEACDESSLDMSPSLFEQLSTLATGEITISWHFENIDWSP